MADIILTDEEKQAKLWSDLDDEDLGKLAKKLMSIWDGKEFHAKPGGVATRLAVSMHNANNDTETYEVKGLTIKGKKIEDYIVTVRRK